MLQKWSELEAFHKLSISLGVVVSIFLIYFIVIINPINNKSSELEAKIDSWSSIYVWMQENTPKIKAFQESSKSKGAVGEKKIHTLVSETVNKYRLKDSIKKIDKTGSRAVKVSFNNAPFDTVIQWINFLKKNYSVSTVSAAIKKSNGIGTVDGAITLEAAE